MTENWKFYLTIAVAVVVIIVVLNIFMNILKFSSHTVRETQEAENE